MRDYAVDLLRDSVESDTARPEVEVATAGSSTNPFALGIPVLLMGAVLVFIFPPVGVALLLLGGITCVIGVGIAMVNSARESWRRKP